MLLFSLRLSKCRWESASRDQSSPAGGTRPYQWSVLPRRSRWRGDGRPRLGGGRMADDLCHRRWLWHHSVGRGLHRSAREDRPDEPEPDILAPDDGLNQTGRIFGPSDFWPFRIAASNFVWRLLS